MKPGRNEPCPCGSGKKFKKCCDEKFQTALTARSIQAKGIAPKPVDTSQLIALLNAGRYIELESQTRFLIKQYPENGFLWKLLGTMFHHMGRDADALACIQKAAILSPSDAEAHSNLGNALKGLGQLDDAVASYRRALQINPDFAVAHNNLGLMLHDLRLKANSLSEAEASYRRALKLKPDFVEAQYNLSHLLLILGRYAEAWPYYESRYDPNRTETFTKIPSLSYPQWQGESIVGKSLVIYPEQGFGDYIQFARYAPMLKDRGVSYLTFFCHLAHMALLGTMEGVDAVITDPTFIPIHDYWSFSASLPLHLGTTVNTIPSVLPYLHTMPARVMHWHDRLPQSGFRVGLVWKGNPNHKNDANRSLPGLATLAQLWSVPEVTFISLQKGQGEDEAKQPPADQPIIHLGSDIRDFADTAAIVAQLDLVICVDTAVAHVVGALGKPCWVLLPAFGTDWRWLLDRTDSPWYPGVMRLFRQSKLDDWDETISEVVDELRMLVSAKAFPAIYADAAESG